MSELRLCPICRRPLEETESARRFRPFCSKRCADVDLSRWLHGTYGIPAVEAEDERAAESDAPEPRERTPLSSAKH
ncbi:MAG TPA: DNA gyrase inhibitor YacG [Micropepsaceae bacterium]|nr:DNA gyrase inhibitor YacG [Micropepsaceae bacterium]